MTKTSTKTTITAAATPAVRRRRRLQLSLQMHPHTLLFSLIRSVYLINEKEWNHCIWDRNNECFVYLLTTCVYVLQDNIIGSSGSSDDAGEFDLLSIDLAHVDRSRDR